MTHRLGTRIGLPANDDRSSQALDVVRFREPAVGALVRTKGSLFLLAQVSGTQSALRRAASEMLEALEHDYYYDLSAGPLGALDRALRSANRRVFHQRRRLRIPARGGISAVALAIRGREAHVAKLGAASSVIVRDGRMYELPPPVPVSEDDPRVRPRRLAVTLGEALEVEPFTWQGELAPDDRIALVSRQLAQTVGSDQLKQALVAMRPSQAVEYLRGVFAIRGGSGSDGMIAVEITELAATATTRELEPVRLSEPLAGLPDESPVPLADAIGRSLYRVRDAGRAARMTVGRGALVGLSWVLAFVPRRRPRYPRSIPRTFERTQERRRRIGLAGMAVIALMLAVGSSVASLPSARPTDAIPRASVARAAIADAAARIDEVQLTIGGASLVDRDPAAAEEELTAAAGALSAAAAAGVPDAELAGLLGRLHGQFDMLHRVARIGEAAVVADLAAALDDVDPREMVAASDGSLWVLDAGRGRVLRVDPADGAVSVVYRAGERVDGLETTPADPWLMATAATDVVVIDRDRHAWRIDLAERIARPMVLAGSEQISSRATLLGALQHRPPLEIFTLYLVDPVTSAVNRWTPPAIIPVEYRDSPESFLSGEPDLDPGLARDLRVDVNLWLLHADTVTRVDFGAPRDQADYSLDAPPDAATRPVLDFRLLDGATVGDREFLYVYDAANARIIAFQRADGAFVRQWLADSTRAAAGVLEDVRGLAVTSVADGPPAAYLLTSDGVLRVVLE